MNTSLAESLIASSRPARNRWRGSTLVLLGISILLGAFVADDRLLGGSAWGWFIPQVLMLVLLGIMVQKARQQRNVVRTLERSLEAVQLQSWKEAREGLEQVLKRPLRSSNARAESLLGLAAVAEAEGSHDASQTIYEALLHEQSADPLQLHTARVALAAVLLRNGQITDAVSLIERLERAGLPESLKAQVELVSLFREVTMGQADAGVARAQERRRLFREYLSTRAGYGYGLLAAAFDRKNDFDSARALWHDATLLIEPGELVSRYREVSAVAGKYPAAENPL